MSRLTIISGLVSRDLTAAMILERSAFEKVSGMIYDFMTMRMPGLPTWATQRSLYNLISSSSCVDLPFDEKAPSSEMF